MREKTSLSFDMIIESNLPCPLLDFAYVSRIADGRTQTQTGVWTKKRRSIQEALPESSNITGGILERRMVDPRKEHSIVEL